MRTEFVQPRFVGPRFEEATLPVEVARDLAAYEKLVDGWYDQKGKAPAKDKLAKLATHLLGHYPESLALPAIVPTPEGNLLLEWDAEGDPSVDLDLDTLTASYHAFGMKGGEVEREFDLNSEAAWAGFYDFLQANIESRPA